MTPRRRDSVDLDIACRMELVTPVEGAVETAARSFGLGREPCHFLALAVREAVINAIRHGCPRPEERLQVSLRRVRSQVLVITIRDRGPGFDPARVPDPRLPENLKKGTGRGLFYMREFCDRVSFVFPPEGGTLVRLEKRLPKRSSNTETFA